MIHSLKELKFYIKADRMMSRLNELPWYKRIFHVNNRASFLKTPRITEYLNNNKRKTSNWWMWIPYFFYSRKLDRLSYACGYDIPLNSLGYGVCLPHHGSCIINGAIHIGNYCALMNNVCIADGNPKKIGNGVFFATGVVIAKHADIADGVSITANSFVNKPITKPNSLWGGVNTGMLKEYKAPWYMESPWYENYLFLENERKKLGIE